MYSVQTRLNCMNPKLRQRFEQKILNPLMFPKKHLFYRSAMLEEYELIPMSFVPYLANVSKSEYGPETVFAGLEASGFQLKEIPFCMVAPKQFLALNSDIQCGLYEGMLWGYNWAEIVPKDRFYYSNVFYYNQACLLGFIDSELIWSDDVERCFNSKFEKYQRLMKLGKENEEYQCWIRELNYDPWSMLYQCDIEATFFGRLIGIKTSRYDYWKRFRFPYALRSEWPSTEDPMDVSSTELEVCCPQIELQDYVGFSSRHLMCADDIAQGTTMRKQFKKRLFFQRSDKVEETIEQFDPHWILNPDLGIELVEFIHETLQDFAKSGAKTKTEISYLLNSIAHSEFNGFSKEKLTELVLLPFCDKVKLKYGEKVTVYQVLQEQQNAFGGSLDEYVGHVLMHNAYQSRNANVFELIKKNPDLLEEILEGLNYFETISKVHSVIAKAKAIQPLKYKEVLNSVIQIQKVIVEQLKETDGAKHTLLIRQELFNIRELGYEKFIPEGSQYSIELLHEIRRGLSMRGLVVFYSAFESIANIPDIQGNESVDDLYRIYLIYHRLYYQRYKIDWDFSENALSLGFVSLLVELLSNGVNIQPLMHLPQEIVQEFSGLLLRDPSLVSYVDKESSETVLRLYLTMRNYSPLDVVPIGVVEGYRDSAKWILNLLNAGRIEPNQIEKYPEQPAFWLCLDYASRFIDGLRVVLKKYKNKDKWKEFAAGMPLIESVSDLMIDGELFRVAEKCGFEEGFEVLQKRYLDFLDEIKRLMVGTFVPIDDWNRKGDKELPDRLADALWNEVKAKVEEDAKRNEIEVSQEYWTKLETGSRFVAEAVFGKSNVMFSLPILELEKLDMILVMTSLVGCYKLGKVEGLAAAVPIEYLKSLVYAPIDKMRITVCGARDYQAPLEIPHSFKVDVELK